MAGLNAIKKSLHLNYIYYTGGKKRRQPGINCCWLAWKQIWMTVLHSDLYSFCWAHDLTLAHKFLEALFHRKLKYQVRQFSKVTLPWMSTMQGRPSTCSALKISGRWFCRCCFSTWWFSNGWRYCVRCMQLQITFVNYWGTAINVTLKFLSNVLRQQDDRILSAQTLLEHCAHRSSPYKAVRILVCCVRTFFCKPEAPVPVRRIRGIKHRLPFPECLLTQLPIDVCLRVARCWHAKFGTWSFIWQNYCNNHFNLFRCSTSKATVDHRWKRHRDSEPDTSLRGRRGLDSCVRRLRR